MRFWVFVCLYFLGGCASDPYWPWNSQKSKYDRLLNSKVYEKKLFERGRVLVGAKLLLLDTEIEGRQKEIFPILVDPRETKLASTQRWIIALDTAGRDPLSLNQLKLQLGGRAPLKIKEIDNLTTMEALYSFAYPYLKVFEVDFEAPKDLTVPVELEIVVPMGKVVFEVNKIIQEAKS